MADKHATADAAWLLALLMTPGIGVVTVNRVALALKEANIPFHAVIGHTSSVLRKGLPGGLEWVVEPLARCEEATVDRAIYMHDRVLSTGGQWLTRWTAEYPDSLIGAMEYSAPPVLSVYGDTELLGNEAVAIVGSRDPSDRGRLLAEELSSWSVAQGRSVVSGGARGIDLAAHTAATEAGGNTILMIPQGGLTYEGPSWLKGSIESGNAAVVSAFVPDTEWSASCAMSRNRTVAALGRIVCVIDPGVESGSHRTAGIALEYEKRTLVYAYDKVESAYGDVVRKGGYPILDEHAAWDELYLENHWTGGGQLSRKQTDLF